MHACFLLEATEAAKGLLHIYNPQPFFWNKFSFEGILSNTTEPYLTQNY